MYTSADTLVLAAIVVLLAQLSYAAAYTGMPATWVPRRGAMPSSSSSSSRSSRRSSSTRSNSSTSSSSSTSVPFSHHPQHDHHHRHHRQNHHTHRHHSRAASAATVPTGFVGVRPRALSRLCLGAATSEDNINHSHADLGAGWPVEGASTTTTSALPTNSAGAQPDGMVPPVVGDIRRESLDTLRVRPRSEEGDAKVERDSPRGNFVQLFRGCAPYIRAHLGAVMVVHMGGEILDDPGFLSLMDDLGLLRLLGVSGMTCCRGRVACLLHQVPGT